MNLRAAVVFSGIMFPIMIAFGQTQPSLDNKVITFAAAKQVAQAAADAAIKRGMKVAIVVVDANRDLVYAVRLDRTQVGSMDTALSKARTAVTYRQSTKNWETLVRSQKRTDLLYLPDLIPLAGGEPIVVDGQVLGAIGISGGSESIDDGAIAEAGAAALAPK